MYFNGYFNDFGLMLAAGGAAPQMTLAPTASSGPSLSIASIDRDTLMLDQRALAIDPRIATRIRATPTESTTASVVAPEAGAEPVFVQAYLVPGLLEDVINSAPPPAGGGTSVKIGGQLALPKGGTGGAFMSPGAALPGTTSGPAPVAQSGVDAGAAGVTCAAATGISNAVPCAQDPNSCCCPPGMTPNAAGNLCIAPAGAGAGAGGLGGSLPLIAGVAALALLFMRR